MNGVFGQWTDSVPVLYISGQVRYDTTIMSCPDLNLRQLGDQEINIVAVVKPLTKYAVCISNPLHVKKELQKAVYLATNEKEPGPVWLDVPMNVQGSLIDETTLEEFIPQENKNFSGKEEAKSIAEVINLLKQAKRPVIVAGQGIRLSDTTDSNT